MTLSLPMRRKPRSPGRAPLIFVGAALLAELLGAGSVVSDRLAPITGERPKPIDWAEGRRLISGALERFDREFA